MNEPPSQLAEHAQNFPHSYWLIGHKTASHLLTFTLSECAQDNSNKPTLRLQKFPGSKSSHMG